jgi:hypothetical protein
MSIDHAALDAAFKKYDPTKPIYMLFMSKYRATADYAPYHNDSISVDSSPCTGREAMARYRTTFAAMMPAGAKVQFMGTVAVNVIVPKEEAFDDAVLVRYENLGGFRKTVQSDAYKREVEVHRFAALEDSRLVLLDGLVV